jgi:hypothetical protein
MKLQASEQERKRKMVMGIIAVVAVECIVLSLIVVFLMPGMKVTMASIYAMTALMPIGTVSIVAVVLANKRRPDTLGLPDDLRKL